ncbi:ABC transporter permease [Anaerotruncus rubiinfantis]|jgi:putative ABC transport system permease protein|uniref:ABC transporter permease n=1 Tax=Anaerotruncus rubiinfantis TaxID=1720200 RepID=UPI0008312BF7|nr:ABC transporter permease [Anaerotruncus rubiinfantis]
MSMLALQGAIELGLIYALVALGLFVSYRVLDIPDLTVDGSFTLGAAVCAVLTMKGHPYLGLLFAVAAGWIAGMVTAFLQTKMRVSPILAGILSMTALYSINLCVMGGAPTIALLGMPGIFTLSQAAYYKAAVLLGTVIVVCAFLIVFFRTSTGLCIRATGDNADMVRSSSINTDRMKFIGLGLANALVGLSGALIAQYQSFADTSTGVGMVVIGLASLIVGEVVFGRPNVWRNILAVVLGAVLYRVIIAFVLARGMNPLFLKLISAVLVTVAICYPAVIEQFKLRKLMKEAAKNA